MHCGVSKAMVHQVISRYNRLGVQAVEPPGKGGRRHEYLTLEEEQQFLSPFFARAERGEMATSAESNQAFEPRIGNEVDCSTIYKLLNQQDWTKPRSRPKLANTTKQPQ